MSFDQRILSDGVLNTAELSHPVVHGFSAKTIKLEFMHYGVKHLDEPRVLDGYLFGVLQFVMGGAKKLHIKGAVSEKAIRNANLLGEAWQCWLPEIYKPVEIVAEKVLDQSTLIQQSLIKIKADRSIAAFSGGLDSTFTAIRHARRLLGSAGYKVRDLVMVHGFDVNLHNQTDFDELLRRVEPFVESLGANLRIVKTNIKDAIAHDWEQVFAAQLACVLHQFSHECSQGLIASGAVLAEPDIRWGSTPQLDYLLSGGDFEIVHDGAAFSRTEKAALIAKYPPAIRSVKVCWQGEHQGRNCGLCEKCVRTRLNFLAAGVSDPECFEDKFDLEMIDQLQVKNIQQLNLHKSIIEDGKKLNAGSEWLSKLQHRVELMEIKFAPSNNINFPALSTPSTGESKCEYQKHSDFKKKLQFHFDSIVGFIQQIQPLWLLTEMPGNIGDHLIWAGTERILTLSQLNFHRVSVKELRVARQRRPGALIIPGSGAFVSRWHDWLPDLIISSASLFDRIVILPSQFDPQIPVVREALRLENVYPFAREVYSYSKIKSLGRAALALDPALWSIDLINAKSMAFDDRNTANNQEILIALRTDKGSLLAEHGYAAGYQNIDISLSSKSLEEFLTKIQTA